MLDPQIPLSVKPPPPYNVLQSLGDVMRVKNEQQIQQMNQLKLEEAQGQFETQRAKGEAWKHLGDRKAILQSLAESGHPEAIPDTVKIFNDWDSNEARLRQILASTTKTQQDIDTAQRDVVAGVAWGVRQHLNDPDKGLGAAAVGLAQLYNTGHLPADQRDQYLQQFKENPDSIKTVTDQLIAQSSRYATLASQEVARQATANRPFDVRPSGRVVSPTGQVLYEAPAAPPAPTGGFTLGAGQQRYDGQGRLVATGPPKPATGAPGGGFSDNQVRLQEVFLKTSLDRIEAKYEAERQDRTNPEVQKRMSAEMLNVYNTYRRMRRLPPLAALPWKIGAVGWAPESVQPGGAAPGQVAADPREARARALMAQITQKKQDGEDVTADLAELQKLVRQ